MNRINQLSGIKDISPWVLVPDGNGEVLLANEISDNIIFDENVINEVVKLLPDNIILPRKAIYYKLINMIDNNEFNYYLVLIKDRLNIELDKIIDLGLINNQIMIVQINRSVVCDFEDQQCCNSLRIEEAWLIR